MCSPLSQARGAAAWVISLLPVGVHWAPSHCRAGRALVVHCCWAESSHSEHSLWPAERFWNYLRGRLYRRKIKSVKKCQCVSGRVNRIKPTLMVSDRIKRLMNNRLSRDSPELRSSWKQDHTISNMQTSRKFQLLNSNAHDRRNIWSIKETNLWCPVYMYIYSKEQARKITAYI